MRYYKSINPDTGVLEAIGTGEYGGEEISEEEYNALMAEITASIPPVEPRITLEDALEMLRELGVEV